MRALGKWREAALRQRAKLGLSPPAPPSGDGHEGADPTPPPSPPPSDDHEQAQAHDRQYHTRSRSEPPKKLPGKQTSSWVQWWNRGRRGKPSASPNDDMDSDEFIANTNTSQDKLERPTLHEMPSAPLQNVSIFSRFYMQFGLTSEGQTTVVSPAEPTPLKLMKEMLPAESAPALPSTPVQSPVKDTVVVAAPLTKRKFAKTLRLTSEQLVCR